MIITDGEKYMTLQELALRICNSYDDIDNGCKVCPAAEHCTTDHNGMMDWLREVIGNAGAIADAQPAVQDVDVGKALAWLEYYTMTDTKQVYSNGCVYVPLYRVKQAFEDKAYNGLLEG